MGCQGWLCQAGGTTGIPPSLIAISLATAAATLLYFFFFFSFLGGGFLFNPPEEWGAHEKDQLVTSRGSLSLAAQLENSGAQGESSQTVLYVQGADQRSRDQNKLQ